MKAKTFLTGVVVLAGMTQMATASDYQSNVNPSGPFDVAASWQVWNGSSWVTATNAPGANDRVTIRSGDTITIDTSLACDAFVVESTGVLAIGVSSGSGDLTVDGSAFGASLAINGTVVLGDATHTGALQLISNDFTCSGSGSIQGQNASSSLDIGNGRTLTNKMTFQGMFQIQEISGTAALVMFADASNTAILKANAAGPLALSANVKLTESINSGYTPQYQADGTGLASHVAELQFNYKNDGSDANHPVLQGPFQVINCAVMNFPMQPVYTKGSLTANTGGQVLTNGASAPVFRYDWVNAGVYNEISGNQTFGSCP